MTACPSLDLLAQVLAGKLDELSAEALRRHVSACPVCQSHLDRLSDDTELGCFKARGGPTQTPLPQEPGLARLLRKLATHPPETTDGTGLLPKGTAPVFFGPPRCPGELGTLGPYRVIEELGRGGMGLVYRGHDDKLERVVAIKVLRPELANERTRARLLGEARTVARFKNEHVVGIYAVADPGEDVPYLVMEYVAGPTLAQLIREHGPLPPGEAAEILTQAAEGVAAAHAARLIHRDIKPGNLILETGPHHQAPPSGPSVRVKILDFGLARVAEAASGLTQEGTLAGTPSYMSPEQVGNARDVDGRTDVYSLGVTFYEMLTREVPFRGTSQMVLQQVVYEEPRPPRRLNDAIPRDLETICLKAMAKEPARRYPTAAELRDDLRRWQRGEPIRARPLGVVGRGWRWCRRRPLVASLLATLVLALVGVCWQWLRADHQAGVATRQRDRAMDVVDDSLVQISEDRLLNEPGLQPLRLELLQKAARSYQDFVADQPHDPVARFRLVKTLVQLARTTSQVEGPAPALDMLHQAVAMQRTLVQEYPDDPRYGLLLIDALNQLGACQDTALQFDKAEAVYEESLRLCRSDTSPAHRLREMKTLNGLGVLLAHQRQFSREETVLLQAIPIGTSLVEQQLELPESRSILGLCHDNLGWAYLNLGALNKRADVLARARVLWERTLAENPKDLSAQHYWLATLRNLGEQYLTLRQPGPALEALTQALPLTRQQAEKNPAVRASQESLMLLHSNLGLAHQLAGAWSPAESEFHEAVTVAERLDRTAAYDQALGVNGCLVRSNLGTLYAQLGRLDEAIDEYGKAARALEAILKRSPQLEPGRYLLCGVYSGRANALMELGQVGEAVADAERALANDRGYLPHLLALSHGLMKARLEGTDTTAVCRLHSAEAMRELEQFVPRNILFGSAFYGIACIGAQASVTASQDDRIPAAERTKRAEEFARRAMDYLRAAQADGYFRLVPGRVARLEDDPSLAPLRPRADFQELLAQVKEPAPGR